MSSPVNTVYSPPSLAGSILTWKLALCASTFAATLWSKVMVSTFPFTSALEKAAGEFSVPWMAIFSGSEALTFCHVAAPAVRQRRSFAMFQPVAASGSSAFSFVEVTLVLPFVPLEPPSIITKYFVLANRVMPPSGAANSMSSLSAGTGRSGGMGRLALVGFVSVPTMASGSPDDSVRMVTV